MIYCPRCDKPAEPKHQCAAMSRRWFLFGALGAVVGRPPSLIDRAAVEAGLNKMLSQDPTLRMFGMPLVVTPKAPPNTITMIAPLKGYRIVGSPDGSRWYYVADVAQTDLSTSNVRSGRVEATFRC